MVCARFLMTIPLMLLCTGCWDSTEIDRLAIISATGVDLVRDADNKPIVRGTAQIARPSELGSSGGGAPQTSSGSTQAFILEQADGDDFVASLERIRQHLSRRLFLGQRRVSIIGEDYARNGVASFMDEVIRNPQSRLRTYVLIAYHDQAQSILKLPYSLTRLPADAMADMEDLGVVLKIDAKDFIQSLTDWGDPVAMGIETVRTPHGVSGKSSETFAMNHIAVFQKDKLVGWLGGNDVRGFKWILGKIQAEDTTVKLPGMNGAVSARVMSVRSSRTVSLASGQPMLNVDVHAEYDINQNGTNLNLNDPKNMEITRLAIAKELVNSMEGTMKTLQKQYDADSLGFSNLIFERYPRLWRKIQSNWRQLYPSLPVRFHVDVLVRNTGLTGTPLTQLIKAES